MKVKILDTTLRDGGYINNWNFGAETISLIENALLESGIDEIESGFLTSKYSHSANNTLYNNIYDLKNKMVMVNLGEYDLSLTDSSVALRIAFKKHELELLRNSLGILVKKGVNFSLNPMHISLYSDKDFALLADVSNEFGPECLTAVDTMGIMNGNDTKRIFLLLDEIIDKKIDLGFHAHDNLELAYSNTIELLNMNIERTLVIDSCLDGIGRGGGMLSTNVIAMYLNDIFGKHYNISLLDDLSGEYIHPLNNYDKYPYYLTAIHKCHPNYGKYLADRNISYDAINNILGLIPSENRMVFSENLIEHLYKENFHSV